MDIAILLLILLQRISLADIIFIIAWIKGDVLKLVTKFIKFKKQKPSAHKLLVNLVLFLAMGIIFSGVLSVILIGIYAGVFVLLCRFLLSVRKSVRKYQTA